MRVWATRTHLNWKRRCGDGRAVFRLLLFVSTHSPSLSHPRPAQHSTTHSNPPATAVCRQSVRRGACCWEEARGRACFIDPTHRPRAGGPQATTRLFLVALSRGEGSASGSRGVSRLGGYRYRPCESSFLLVFSQTLGTISPFFCGQRKRTSDKETTLVPPCRAASPLWRWSRSWPGEGGRERAGGRRGATHNNGRIFRFGRCARPPPR